MLACPLILLVNHEAPATFIGRLQGLTEGQFKKHAWNLNQTNVQTKFQSTKDNMIRYTGSLDGTKACHGHQFNPDSNSKL